MIIFQMVCQLPFLNSKREKDEKGNKQGRKEILYTHVISGKIPRDKTLL